MSSLRKNRRIIKILVSTLVSLGAIIFVSAVPDKAPNSSNLPADMYKVATVYDGDTIGINYQSKIEKVRLLGVDTPETKDPRKPVQCFGREASAFTKQLLEGKSVRLAFDSTQGERDKYGRLLAYVYTTDNIFVNQKLIEEGYAHEYTFQGNPYQFQTEFQLAERSARVLQRGLWSDQTCQGVTK